MDDQILSHDLLQIVDAIASERGIDTEEVFLAMEQALLRVAKGNYGPDLNIDVRIDRRSGRSTISRLQKVVEFVEDASLEISLEEARAQDTSVSVDDYLAEELPAIPFGRMAAQAARQVIIQRVRDAERARQYEEFKDRVGEIVTGFVKRIEFGHAILDLGRAEAIVRKEHLILREPVRVGDRLKVLIIELRPDAKGPIIVASRTHPHFIAKLLDQEVPEVYEGLIDVRSVSRDSGSRAKVAVSSDDPSLDPVGSCVGMRGARIQAITNELRGEKIDVILWSPNIATFAVNALAPAEVLKVVIDEDAQKLRVIVPDDQLSLAIGRRGQNVRLASQLIGWSIDVTTETAETEARTIEMAERCQLFSEALDVDDMFSRLLYAEGFDTVEDVAMIDLEEFASVEGLNHDIAKSLQDRAKSYLEKKQKEFEAECLTQGIEESLIHLKGLMRQDLEKLIKANIKTRDDLADLSGFDLVGILGKDSCSIERANQIVMAARSHWFESQEESE